MKVGDSVEILQGSSAVDIDYTGQVGKVVAVDEYYLMVEMPDGCSIFYFGRDEHWAVKGTDT